MRRRPLLGYLLIREGLITTAQLDEALRAQSQTDSHVALGQILVEGDIISQAQLDFTLDKYHRRYRLGDLLVETKVITPARLRLALDLQRKTGQRLGEVLLKLNLATEEQVKRALGKQFGAAFVDLDVIPIDRRVAHLLNRRYAELRRVLPIAKVENRITLAMDDPADVEVVDELASSTGFKVDVVTSTYGALQQAIARAYEEPSEQGPASRQESREGASQRPGTEDRRREVATAPPSLEEVAPRAQREFTAGALRELQARQADVARDLAEFQTAHEALRKEHAEAVRAMRELADQHAQVLADLEAARLALQQAREENARTVLNLEERHAEALRALSELRASYGSLREEHEAATLKLREWPQRYDVLLQDRRTLAEGLEAILDRLKP